MSTFSLGRYRIVPQGEYSHTQTYYLLDLVTLNGSSWLCRMDNTTGIYPPANMISNERWQLVGAKGDSIVTLTQAQIDDIVAQVEASDNFVPRSEFTPTDNNFTDEMKTAVENIGNGNITIKKNNVTVDTFNVNTDTDKTINIEVPTSLDDLAINKNIVTAPDVTVSGESVLDITIDEDSHMVINENITGINVNLPYDSIVEAAKFGRYQVIFSVDSALEVDIITGIENIYHTFEDYTFEAGNHYMLDIYMGVASIQQLY